MDDTGRYNEFLYPDEGNQRPANNEAPGIASLDNATLKIWPNPVSDYVMVDYHRENGALEIRNIQGILVHSCVLRQGVQQVDLRTLPAGIYVYHIKDTDGVSANGKFMKQ